MASDQIDRIREQFTRTADAYARMRQTNDDRAHDVLVAVCNPGPEARALDVACGPGFLTLALARRCKEATGFDATDAFLEHARAEALQRGQKNVCFEQGDAGALPYADGAFDLVTCRAAFHHFPEPARVLAEMARVTAPDGQLMVADLLGSEEPTRATLHDRIERLCDPTHERALPLGELHALFADAGLATAREIASTSDYELNEWMSHGDPPDAARREITSLMESCLEDDRAGLSVRRDADGIHFTHRTAAFILEHARAGSDAGAT